jgi:hypothetical protein
MKALERRGQILIDNVGVDHRRGEITMAQGFLHQANILGLPVEFRRKHVPQHMGMDILDEPGFATPALHHGPEGTGVDRRPLQGGE